MRTWLIPHKMGVQQVYLFALSIYAIAKLKNEAIFCYSNLIFSFTNTYTDKLYVQERTVNIPRKKKNLDNFTIWTIKISCQHGSIFIGNVPNIRDPWQWDSYYPQVIIILLHQQDSLSISASKIYSYTNTSFFSLLKREASYDKCNTNQIRRRRRRKQTNATRTKLNKFISRLASLILS